MILSLLNLVLRFYLLDLMTQDSKQQSVSADNWRTPIVVAS